LHCNRGRAPDALAACFLLIVAGILPPESSHSATAARFGHPATVSAISDSIRWAERIMEEIDRRHPAKPAQQEQASR